MASYLKLDFEGSNGAVSWEEEAQSLTPSIFANVKLSTDQFYKGNSSLKVGLVTGNLNYIVPNIPSDFKMRCYFRYYDVDNWFDVFGLTSSTGPAAIWMYLYKDSEGAIYFFIYGYDANNNLFGNDSPILCSIPINFWNKVEVFVLGRDISIKVNNVERAHWTAVIDNPLLGIDQVIFDNGNTVSGNEWYLDSVRLVDYTDDYDFGEIADDEYDAFLTPVWVSQGKFFIERPTFQVEANQIVTGLWGRQSTAVLGEPFAQKINKLWDETTSFFAICKEIIEGVGLVWDSTKCEIPNYTIYANTFEADSIYPIEVLQNLITLIVGDEGFITSDRLGNICIKKLVREPLTSDSDITDLIVQTIGEEPVWPTFGNRIKIIPSNSLSQNTIEISMASECIGMTEGASYIEIKAQVKDGDSVPLNGEVVTWSLSPAEAANLGFVYPTSAGFQKTVSQNTSKLLISKEAVRATGITSVEVAFIPDSVIGIWAYSDTARSKNFAPAGGYTIDGKHIYLTSETFTYCDQMVLISYYASGMVVNSIMYDPSVSDANGEAVYGEVVLVATVSGIEDSKTIYINNSCQCPNSLTVTVDPSSIAIGEEAILTAYVENGDMPISGKISMVEITGLGSLQWMSKETSVTTVTNETTEVVNSIAGVSQCVVGSMIDSVVGVYPVITDDEYDDSPDISKNYFSSFIGKIIDLINFHTTGIPLMVTYKRAGSVINYLTGVADGTSQVVVSLPANTEEGLSQTVSITIAAAADAGGDEYDDTGTYTLVGRGPTSASVKNALNGTSILIGRFYMDVSPIPDSSKYTYKLSSTIAVTSAQGWSNVTKPEYVEINLMSQVITVRISGLLQIYDKVTKALVVEQTADVDISVQITN